MAYFSCPMRPEYTHQHPAVIALDPFLQALFAQLQQPDEQHPATTTTTTPAAQQQERKPKAAPAARPATSTTSRPTPTLRNPNRTDQAFSPRFDVYETSDAYYLEGDLPGVGDKKAVGIEFSDSRTLLVRGRVGRAVAKPAEQTTSTEEKRRSLKPTVEDTDDEDDFSVVSAGKKEDEVVKYIEVEEPKGEPKKVWLSERTFGTFQRTFSFPSPVDLERVSAKLENGLLTIVVPKVFFGGVRKIEIE